MRDADDGRSLGESSWDGDSKVLRGLARTIRRTLGAERPCIENLAEVLTRILAGILRAVV